MIRGKISGYNIHKIVITYFFTLDIAIYVSLVEQPIWRWICFESCGRFTAYLDQNISVTILE